MENETETTPMEGSLSAAEITRVVEALLFVSEKPLTLAQIRQVLEPCDKGTIEEAVTTLKDKYAGGAVTLVEVAQGLQLRTTPAYAPWVRKLISIRPVRLSQAALEVLAIIAYRQPISRAQIEDVRGVDCGGVLKTLLERNLIKTIGKADEPGRPLLYGTSNFFLEVFGLRKLTDLPPLKEFQELTPEEAARLEGKLNYLAEHAAE